MNDKGFHQNSKGDSDDKKEKMILVHLLCERALGGPGGAFILVAGGLGHHLAWGCRRPPEEGMTEPQL